MLATWGCTTFSKPTLDLQFVGATSLDNRITFSRGSQATLFDSAGTLVYAKHNLFLQSQSFNTTWATTNASVTANNQSAPDDTATADTIVRSGTVNSSVAQSFTATPVTYVASVFAKAGTQNFLALQVNTNGVTRASFITFDLTNGSIGTEQTLTTNVGLTATATSLSNGWYRCSVSYTSLGGTDNILFNPSNAANSRNGIDTGTVILWGAQLNLAGMEGGVTSSLATYYPTTTAAYYAPRFDYNPSTLAAQGLLIEEQRTNNALQSEDFATTWTATGATVSINAATAPSGALTADKLVEDSSTGSHLVTQNITYSAVTYTASLFAKKAERDWVRVLFFDGTNTFSAFFNLNTGVVGTVSGAGASAAIQNVGNGWYRCLVTATTAAGAGTFAPRVALADNNSSYTGSTGSGIYIWGAQLEAGAFATSYIPTTTTALTRNADVASMTGTNFSSWYNQTEGTLFSESINLPGQSAVVFPRIANINDGTTNNVITTLWRSDTSRLYGAVAVSGVNVADVGANGVTQTNINKIALGYATNNFAASVNGAAASTDTSGNVPTGLTTLAIGKQASSADFINGYIRRIAYYPVRLANTTLQALTA